MFDNRVTRCNVVLTVQRLPAAPRKRCWCGSSRDSEHRDVWMCFGPRSAVLLVAHVGCVGFGALLEWRNPSVKLCHRRTPLTFSYSAVFVVMLTALLWDHLSSVCRVQVPLPCLAPGWAVGLFQGVAPCCVCSCVLPLVGTAVLPTWHCRLSGAAGTPLCFSWCSWPSWNCSQPWTPGINVVFLLQTENFLRWFLWRFDFSRIDVTCLLTFMFCSARCDFLLCSCAASLVFRLLKASV